MPLSLGQLVYASFFQVGFQSLSSPQIPKEIQQAFIKCIVRKRWNAYNPPEVGYRAAYLYQVSPEDTLFGWLYTGIFDEWGRSGIPYFISYYLAQPVHPDRLQDLFTCLHAGPIQAISLQFPAPLETIAIPDVVDYRSAIPGVKIPLAIQQRCQLALGQGKLLNLLVLANGNASLATRDRQISARQQKPAKNLQSALSSLSLLLPRRS